MMVRRCRHIPILFGTRTKLVAMWLRGMSCSAIARDTGISTTTVCRWINRWRLEGHVNARHRPETSKTLTPQNLYSDAALASVWYGGFGPSTSFWTENTCHLQTHYKSAVPSKLSSCSYSMYLNPGSYVQNG